MTTDTMKAWRIEHATGLEALQCAEVPRPRPRVGELVVRGILGDRLQEKGGEKTPQGEEGQEGQFPAGRPGNVRQSQPGRIDHALV